MPDSFFVDCWHFLASIGPEDLKPYYRAQRELAAKHYLDELSREHQLWETLKRHSTDRLPREGDVTVRIRLPRRWRTDGSSVSE